MSNDSNDKKILIQAARSVLNPMGLFQKGQTRIWIDDHGWFLIIIEFQQSDRGKGSYLNVGINFLWREQDYISFDYGSRVFDFVSYDGDDKLFDVQCQLLAEMAAEWVTKYRKFQNIKFAHIRMIKSDKLSSIWGLYHKMFICWLLKDKAAKKYYIQLLQALDCDRTAWQQEIYQEIVERIEPMIARPLELQQYILDKIDKQRAYWHGSSGMKKLNATWDKSILRNLTDSGEQE